MANFLHEHVYGASLHYLMSIRTIDPVCPQAILPMLVTLYPSGTLCATNIPLRNNNDAYDFTELDGKYSGESFMSLRFIVFELYLRKFEKLPISRKKLPLTPQNGAIFDLG